MLLRFDMVAVIGKMFIYITSLTLVMLVDPYVGADDAKIPSRVVQTKYGQIQGVLVNTPNKNVAPVEAFLGVPFASPPVKHRRFMPPVIPSQWRGVRNVERFAPVCPQKLPEIRNETELLRHMPLARVEYLKRLVPFLKNESEDCLYLNIYCPVRRQGIRSYMPVIVFLHGESYDFGSGNAYDGSVLAGFGEVIVITLNYRLGILGFLPALEPSTSGNYGLMDIILALHFVQESIAHFGGDPRNITLIGHGHGAACAHLLMLSPLARGLFQRVVLQSGSAFSPWAVANEGILFTRSVGRKLNCPVVNHTVLLECMRLRPLNELKRVQVNNPDYLSAFGPMVDGVVIPADPETLLRNPPDDYHKNRKVDILIGFTRIESNMFFGAYEEHKGIEPDRRDRMLRTLVRNLFNFHLQEIFLTIVNEYTDWSKAAQHPVVVLDGALDALTDALVVAPAINTANLLSKLKHRTFLYVFNYPTEASETPRRLVCVHGEDLPYVFGAPLVGKLSHFPTNYTKADITLSEAMMLYWTNFARYGDPNLVLDGDSPQTSKNRFERIVWPSYDEINQKFMSLAMKPKIKDHYHAHRLSFWLSLIPKLHRQGSSPGIASQHHLLEDHNNPATYDGVVRLPQVIPIAVPEKIPSTQLRINFERPTISSGAEISVPRVFNTSSTFQSSPKDDEDLPQTPVPSSKTVSSILASSDSSVFYKDSYLALKIILGIGSGFLVLNIILFIIFCYPRIRNKCHRNPQRLQRRNSEEPNAPATIKPHNRAPPPSPDVPKIPDPQSSEILPSAESLQPPECLRPTDILPDYLQLIPPPALYIQQSSNQNMIPLEEMQNRSSSEGHHSIDEICPKKKFNTCRNKEKKRKS